MLNREELLHFARHGWVLLPQAFDGAQVAAYVEGLDRLSGTHPAGESGDDCEMIEIQNMIFYDSLFLEWFKTPVILEANAQVLGAQLRFQGVNAHIKRPHAGRKTRVLEISDPDIQVWHRGIRPKWGNFAHDFDSELLNCAFLNNITYLTDVAPGDGGTMILDGSHLHEGEYSDLKSRCPLLEITARAGDVLLFTESLLHSGCPILSENVRYNMYYGFTPPWFCSWPGMEVPPQILDSIEDAAVRELLARTGYIGQDAEIL